jgi:O-antigen/teichoic acid export membrane protein
MRSIARNSVENFFVRIVTQAATVAIGIAVARVLGPAGKGIYLYVGSVLTLTSMAARGQGGAFTYQLARQKQPARVVYSAMLRTIAIFSIPACLGIVAFSAIEPSHGLLLASAVALPFTLYMGYSNGFFLSASDIRSVNMQRIVHILIFLAVIPVMLLGGGLLGLLAIWVASYVGGAIFSLWRMRIYLNDERPTPSPYQFKAQLLFGLKTSLNALVEELNLRIDVFIILAMLGSQQLGIYSIGIGLAAVLWHLNRPISTAALGRISSSEEPQAAQLTARCMRHSFAFVAAASIVLFIVGPTLITLVYGAKFAAAGPVLRLLLPGIVAYCLMPLLAAFFMLQMGRPSIPLALSTVSTIVCAVATAAFIPHYGIAAGAVASSISYVTVAAIGAILFMRRTHISPRQLFILNKEDLHQYLRLLNGVAARVGRLREALVR